MEKGYSIFQEAIMTFRALAAEQKIRSISGLPRAGSTLQSCA
jgi:hypothetical protein